MKKLLGLLALTSSLALVLSCGKRAQHLTAPVLEETATTTEEPTSAGQPPDRHQKAALARDVTGAGRVARPAASNSAHDVVTPNSPEPSDGEVANNPPITANFDDALHTISYSGSYQDLLIPNDPSVIKVTFTLDGGDGGYARVHDTDIFGNNHVVKADGGAGAHVSAAFTTGPAANQIPLGSTVRFVVGGHGTSGNSGGVVGVGFDYGGGGGGTAILLQRPGDASFSLLAVAGGGAGAYQGMFAYSSVDHEPGQGGRSGGSGGNGNGDLGAGQGGSGGSGGGSNPALGSFGGGGGGASTAGGGVDCVGLTPDFNTFEAGEGGPGLQTGGYGGDSDGCVSFTWRNGGFGFGGGGAGSGAGGGGGGYSGGGVGGTTGRGGGGGSFVLAGGASSSVSAGGTTGSPGNGSATYQFELNAPPTVTCKNHTLELDTNGEATLVAADVTNSASDPEAGPLQFSLSKSAFDCGDVGANSVTLTVTDNVGQTASCVATVTVVDLVAPIISSVSVDPAMLWPPDHTMRPIQVTIASSDNCPGSSCEIVEVLSDEALDGLGDGHTEADWEIVNGNLSLRAERSGTGDGRVYKITVECTDASGNKTRSTAAVSVPSGPRRVGASN